MNTYTWEFPKLQAYTQQNGQTNVVYVVHWYLTGKDETEQYTYQAYGFQPIAPYESGSLFVPFEQLTKETVQGWVESAIGSDKVQQLKSDIDTRIENLKNPPVVYLTPSWETQ